MSLRKLPLALAAGVALGLGEGSSVSGGSVSGGSVTGASVSGGSVSGALVSGGSVTLSVFTGGVGELPAGSSMPKERRTIMSATTITTSISRAKITPAGLPFFLLFAIISPQNHIISQKTRPVQESSPRWPARRRGRWPSRC